MLGLLLLSLHLCSGDADSDNLKGMSTMMTRVQFFKASQCRKSCLTALNDKKRSDAVSLKSEFSENLFLFF